MKTLIFTFLGFVSLATTAQITITEADMPAAQDTFRVSTTTDMWSIDVTQTGTNHTWDFSFLTPVNQTLDTMHKVNSTPTLYRFFFENKILYKHYYADFATRGIEINAGGVSMKDVFNYFAINASSYRQLGFGANVQGAPMSIQYDNIDTIYPFPLAYANTSKSDYSYQISIPTFGFFQEDGVRENEVDGWGSLTTPFGTFNAIRVKTTINATDTIYVDQFSFGLRIPVPERIEYKWLGQGTGIPLLQIDETGGAITNITYQDSLRGTILSVTENELEKTVLVYPNPANSYTTITSDFPITAIDIFSIEGKKVGRKTLNNETIYQLETNELPAGSYFLFIHNSKGIVTKQLVVEK